jgi:hypothetical protein
VWTTGVGLCTGWKSAKKDGECAILRPPPHPQFILMQPPQNRLFMYSLTATVVGGCWHGRHSCSVRSQVFFCSEQAGQSKTINEPCTVLLAVCQAVASFSHSSGAAAAVGYMNGACARSKHELGNVYVFSKLAGVYDMIHIYRCTFPSARKVPESPSHKASRRRLALNLRRRLLRRLPARPPPRAAASCSASSTASCASAN